jgi:hypothetical protein
VERLKLAILLLATAAILWYMPARRNGWMVGFSAADAA